jgi:hypothetical protein
VAGSLVGVCALPVSLVGSGLGGIIYLKAERDLGRMRSGRMDPAGIAEAERARRVALVGFWLGALGGACTGPPVAYILLPWLLHR